MAVSCRATVPVAVQFLRQTMRLPYNFSGSSRFLKATIRVYSWHLAFLFSVNRIKPVRQKELFLRWQKRFRRSNDRAQSCRHLKTDQDKDNAPNSKMTFAARAKETAHRVNQTQAETDADHPKEQVQRAHKSD
jgi:biopolymer transport protein ExbB/TolQ